MHPELPDRLFRAFSGEARCDWDGMLVLLVEHLSPNLDEILALPIAAERPFRTQPPSCDTVIWALTKHEKPYDLLTYLIAYGWDIGADLNWAERQIISQPRSILEFREVLEDPVLVRWLVDRGADPSTGGSPPPPAQYMPFKHNGDILHKASIYASLETFLFLESRGARLEHASAVHGAACGGPSQLPILANVLTRPDCDVNYVDTYYHHGDIGVPALFDATKWNNFEGVKLLLAHGADPLIEWKGKTAAEAARTIWRYDSRPKVSNELLRVLDEAERVEREKGRQGVPVKPPPWY